MADIINHACNNGKFQEGPRHECPFCGICLNCGNDHVTEGYDLCSDCLGLTDLQPDEPMTNSAQARPSSSPAPQHRTKNF